ncbi:MAG: hypothetical protein H6838_06535 [Planctomycetes bacterium]|nr:hypothetical protein [Planctomycetota bacterium]MCB9885131.1 hypothetical protein [Planctomycetota bacterium]
MMSRARALPLLTTTLACVAPALAQNLDLDKVGGALGGTTTMQLAGNPGEFYAILLDYQEQSTYLPALGVTLDIRDIYASLSFNLPGFSGVTDASGAASASAVIPNDPALASLTLSLQAVAYGSTWSVSNLVRITPQAAGTFAPLRSQPAVPISGGGVVAGADNELLFVGGSGPVAQTLRTRTEDWSAAGATFGVGLLSQTTTLADGRVLFTGGLDLLTGQPTAAAAVYDPATQTTTTLAMGTARAGHGASLLGNGKVLVTGGSSALNLSNPLSLFTGILVSTELFDPATDTFSPGPNMLEARAMHTSTTLTNGNVLIAGGITLIPFLNIPTVSATAYRFNPSNNSFGFPSTFGGGRFLHSAVALDNGKVLLCGGINIDFTQFLTTLNIQDLIINTRTDCQVYTPGILNFGTFATVNGMQEGRAGAALAALPNGGALMAGGFQLAIDAQTQTFVFGATATADVLGQNTITATGSMAAPRLFPLAVNLPDGTVLVVGGGGNAEVYQR